MLPSEIKGQTVLDFSLILHGTIRFLIRALPVKHDVITTGMNENRLSKK